MEHDERAAQTGKAGARTSIARRLNDAAAGLHDAERLLHRRMGPYWQETAEWGELEDLRAEARRLALATEILADEVGAADAAGFS